MKDSKTVILEKADRVTRRRRDSKTPTSAKIYDARDDRRDRASSVSPLHGKTLVTKFWCRLLLNLKLLSCDKVSRLGMEIRERCKLATEFSGQQTQHAAWANAEVQSNKRPARGHVFLKTNKFKISSKPKAEKRIWDVMIW